MFLFLPLSLSLSETVSRTVGVSQCCVQRVPGALCTYIFSSFTCFSFLMSVDLQGPCEEKGVEEAPVALEWLGVAGVEGA